MKSESIDPIPYKEVARSFGKGRSHLLLGNGFSMACDPIFDYQNLYDKAVELGISARAQAVFERMGTNNFEAVMRLLDDGHWLANNYGLVHSDQSEMLEDLAVIKRTLIEAVAHSHLDHTGMVSNLKKQAAAKFLQPYHNVFTTNYDLLLYWVNMSASAPPPYQDGFRGEWEDPGAETVVFTEHLGGKQGMFFLHGALHLFVNAGELRKHCWCRRETPLTQLIRAGLDMGQYPLFVAEGTHEKKLEQIHRSGYLSYCLSKLGRIKNRLVTLGASFGENDTHILNVIADNLEIKEMFIGLFGDPASRSNPATIAAMGRLEERRRQLCDARKSRFELSVEYFDSATAGVWG